MLLRAYGQPDKGGLTTPALVVQVPTWLLTKMKPTAPPPPPAPCADDAPPAAAP